MIPAIKFAAPTGGVSLFINGFLVVGPTDVGNIGQSVAMYMTQGENVFDLVPSRPDAMAKFQLMDVQDPEAEERPVMLSNLAPNPQLPGQSWRGVWHSDQGVARPPWADALRITDWSSQKAAIYASLAKLRELLERGPDAELLDMLSLKHQSIADALGLSKAEMDQGLTDGLAERRSGAGLRVDLVDFQQFVVVPSPDGAIANARDLAGRDALHILDGRANAGFTVSLALLDSQWKVLR